MFICIFLPNNTLISNRVDGNCVCLHNKLLSWLQCSLTTSLETSHLVWKGPLIIGGDPDSSEDSHGPRRYAGSLGLGLAERQETSLLERRCSEPGLFKGIPRKIFGFAFFFSLVLAQSQLSTVPHTPDFKIYKENPEKIEKSICKHLISSDHCGISG